MKKKYKYAGIALEITRECNKNCAHCSCGKAQNGTLSRQIIDKVFTDVDDCRSVVFFGGEPLLHPEMVEYAIDRIINSKWHTSYVELTTNGSIRDDRIIKAFSAFCQSASGRKALLRISNDQFHCRDEYEAAMQYYSGLCKRYPNISVKYVKSNITSLWNCGNAESMLKTHPDMWNQFFVKAPVQHNHRVAIVDGEVLCQILISANGNVGFADQSSYKIRDELRFGNILDCEIDDLINTVNNQCLLSCRDLGSISEVANADNISRCAPHEDMPADIAAFRPANHLMSHLTTKMQSDLLNLRIRAHKLYPNVPVDEIIKRIKIPSSSDMPLISAVMAKNIEKNEAEVRQYVDQTILEEFDQFAVSADDGQKNIVYDSLRVLARLNAEESAGKEADAIEIFAELQELDAQYKSGLPFHRNDTVFPCDGTLSRKKMRDLHFVLEESKQLRCKYCGKVIRYEGKNIHCVESGGGLKCEYCGHITAKGGAA